MAIDRLMFVNFNIPLRKVSMHMIAPNLLGVVLELLCVKRQKLIPYDKDAFEGLTLVMHESIKVAVVR